MKLHTRDGGVHLHRGLLGSLDALLDERRFVRIHRSAIVNIDAVNELRQDAHGDYIAVLRDHTEISCRTPVSAAAASAPGAATLSAAPFHLYWAESATRARPTPRPFPPAARIGAVP